VGDGEGDVADLVEIEVVSNGAVEGSSFVGRRIDRSFSLLPLGRGRELKFTPLFSAATCVVGY
jgi:hypothetical protein